MISITEATEIIRGNQIPAIATSTDLSNAQGRVLAKEILSPEPLPRFTNSAMDGFAIGWSDIEQAEQGPSITFTVIGESRAGAPFGSEVGPGEAVRINTGAMMPDGADRIVAVEDVTEEAGSISIASSLEHRQYIRFEGEEVMPGDVLLGQGNMITPPALGFLTSAGVESVTIYEKPEVAVLVTGNELVDSGEDIQPWQIRDSNRVMLSTSVLLAGGEVTFAGRCGDSFEETRNSIRKASEAARIILVSGGVSVGPHDLVKEAAEEEGFKRLFWKVRQKPGKPLFFSRREDTLLFGLPGNPVSAIICYIYYIDPLLRELTGREYKWRMVAGNAGERIENSGDRTLFIRTQHSRNEGGSLTVKPLKKQGSHMLSSMTMADGFLLLESGEAVEIGEEVAIHLFPWM